MTALAGDRRTESGAAVPLVTVIVAVYQGERTLERCLCSVWSQLSFSPEIIVIDGGSTDGTRELLAANSHRLAYWQSAPDRGICDAWNQGIEKATGDWLLFLGADDALFDPDVISDVAPLLGARQSEVVYGRVAMSGGPWDGLVLGEPWSWRSFRLRMTIPHQAAFHRRDLFSSVGGFDETFRISADYELLLRRGPTLFPEYTPRTIAVMGGEGISITNPQRTYAEARRAQIRHRSAPRPLVELAYAYRVLRARMDPRFRR